MTGDIGSPRRREFTVLGDVVNTASRMEDEVAGPGEIVISGSTFDRVQNKVKARPLGSRTLRGRATPLEMYAVEYKRPRGSFCGSRKTTPRSFPLMVGQNIGKYRVLDRIGRGGMGTVYRAIDETLHREVAIKVLNAELNDPEVAKRFRAEAITVARLSHPGIATIYELFQHEGSG